MIFGQENIHFDVIEKPILTKMGVQLTVVRLDKIHEHVSGNKIFKLHYFVESCLQTTHKTLLTFGGAYSNHLVATAFLCQQKGLKAIGIVRGEKPKALSHTLLQCRTFGMHLHFISRQDYSNNNEINFIENLKNQFGNFITVPEGGYGIEGAKGAALIMDILKNKNATHICICVGTATTLAGLLLHKQTTQQIIAIPVIKNMVDINDRIQFLLGNDNKSLPTILHEYHFGGYAKYTEELIAFMNSFYTETLIPTDFVYTAKMMYGVMDKIKNGFFKTGSKIFCLHTGGLQGNLSLPQNSIIF